MDKVKPIASVQALSTIQRPTFSPGLLLEDEDLTAGVSYTRDLTRLLFRSLFGCGVICGLRIKAALTCNRRKLAITVDSGVALDCMGEPIHVPVSQPMTYDPDCKPLPKWVYVVVCYTEKCCRPKDVSCSVDEDGSIVHTRTRAGFEIKLYDALPDCVCSCEPQEQKPAQPRGACCPEEEANNVANAIGGAAGQGAGAGRGAGGEGPQGQGVHIVEEDDECQCYAEHNAGICACECGCNCVLLGKILTEVPKGTRDDVQEPPLKVDYHGRRMIRPVLVGYMQCKENHRLERRRAEWNRIRELRDGNGEEDDTSPVGEEE